MLHGSFYTGAIVPLSEEAREEFEEAHGKDFGQDLTG